MLHQYGRSLLEHVIEVSGALGDGGTVEAPSYEDTSATENNGLDPAQDLEQTEHSSKSSGKRKAKDSQSQVKGEDEEDGDNDLAVAFTVLDLSRVIYERILGLSESQPASSKDAKNKMVEKAELKLPNGEVFDEIALTAELGEVYNDLGDVGLESGRYRD